MKLNKSKVNKIIKDIEKYLDELDKCLPIDEEILKQDTKMEYTISFLIEQIANECINLGNHIISSLDLELPTSNKSVFDILTKSKFITETISKKIKDVISVRNIIAHRYTKLSLEELVEIVNNISFVEDFLNQILKKIKRIE